MKYKKLKKTLLSITASTMLLSSIAFGNVHTFQQEQHQKTLQLLNKLSKKKADQNPNLKTKNEQLKAEILRLEAENKSLKNIQKNLQRKVERLSKTIAKNTKALKKNTKKIQETQDHCLNTKDLCHLNKAQLVLMNAMSESSCPTEGTEQLNRYFLKSFALKAAKKENKDVQAILLDENNKYLVEGLAAISQPKKYKDAIENSQKDAFIANYAKAIAETKDDALLNLFEPLIKVSFTQIAIKGVEVKKSEESNIEDLDLNDLIDILVYSSLFKNYFESLKELKNEVSISKAQIPLRNFATELFLPDNDN